FEALSVTHAALCSIVSFGYCWKLRPFLSLPEYCVSLLCWQPPPLGTESRLRFLNFATFRSAVDTADSANSPARVKTGGRQGSVVGRGRFELPTMRPRKGFRV